MNPLLLAAGFALISGGKNLASRSDTFQWAIFGVIIYFLWQGKKILVDPILDLFEGIAEAKAAIDSVIDNAVVTDEELEEIENNTHVVKYFSISWYDDAIRSGVPTENLISDNDAVLLAEKIYDAYDPIDDDEMDVYSALHQAGNKLSVGKLSKIFQREYSTSMLVYMRDFLDNGEMVNCYDIVISDIPNY